MAAPKITKRTYQQVLESSAVRNALNARARLVLPRAQREAANGGRTQLAKRLRVESGVRPGAKAVDGIRRPYARVTADYPEDARKADSGARLTARAILRRASRG